MDKILKKRIVTITKMLLGFFIISLIVFIHKLQTKSLSESLSTIEQLEKLDDATKVTTNKEDSLFREWLEKNNRPGYDKHIKARISLTKFLESYGFKAIVSEKVTGIINFDLSDYTEINNNSTIGFNQNFHIWTSKLISYSKDSLLYSFVTGIDTVSLRHQIDSVLNVLKQRGDYPDGAENKIQGVNFFEESKTVFLMIATKVYGQKSGEQLEFYPEIQQVRTPSLQKIASSNIPALEQYQLDIIKRLDKTFGKIRTDEVKKILNDEYARAYNKVSLLGFDFSTMLFPYFLMLLLFLLSIMLLITIILTERSAVAVFSDNLTEDVIEPLINNQYLRFILWIMIPLCTAYFSLPLDSIEGIKLIILLFFMAVVLGINCQAFYLSVKLK